MSVYFHPIYNAVVVICLGLAVMGTVMRTEKMVHDLIFSLPLKSIEEENFPLRIRLCACLERGVYHSCRSVAVSEGIMRQLAQK